MSAAPDEDPSEPPNYFAPGPAARRYAAGRPFFHPLVMARIQERTGISKFGRGLDVGCGTGQSTRALRSIASSVIGIDPSREMLDQAEQTEGIDYRVASAEDLPFEAESFDIATVALAIHWLDRDRFLPEVNRALKKEGLLVIYQNGFFGTMEGNSDYETWHKETYLGRYPTPPRNTVPLNSEEAGRHGFDWEEPERYRNEVSFSLPELADYLSTQSNVINQVELGSDSLAAATEWLHSELSPLFRKDREVFAFGGTILLLRKRTA